MLSIVEWHHKEVKNILNVMWDAGEREESHI